MTSADGVPPSHAAEVFAVRLAKDAGPAAAVLLVRNLELSEERSQAPMHNDDRFNEPPTLEKVLESIDVSPVASAWRVLIGFAALPLLSLISGEDRAGWVVAPFVILVLFTIRVVSAAARRIVPTSERLRSVWAQRRQIAKKYDSYQWNKLLWFGIGLTLYVVLSRRFTSENIIVCSICLFGGSLGAARWRIDDARTKSRAVQTELERHNS